MLALLLASVLGQSMFGGPPSPPVLATVARSDPPPVDVQALGAAIGKAVAENLVPRLAADRADVLRAIERTHDTIVKLAAEPMPPPPPVVTAPPPPPQRIYVARDAAGFDWNDTDQTRLLDWVEQRNLKIRKASVVKPAVTRVPVGSDPIVLDLVRSPAVSETVARTITAPTITLPPVVAAPPPATYGFRVAAPRRARICLPGVGCFQ